MKANKGWRQTTKEEERNDLCASYYSVHWYCSGRANRRRDSTRSHHTSLSIVVCILLCVVCTISAHRNCKVCIAHAATCWLLLAYTLLLLLLENNWLASTISFFNSTWSTCVVVIQCTNRQRESFTHSSSSSWGELRVLSLVKFKLRALTFTHLAPGTLLVSWALFCAWATELL